MSEMSVKKASVRWGRAINHDTTQDVGAGDRDLPSKEAHGSDWGTLLSRSKLREKVRKMKRSKTMKNNKIGFSHTEARTLATSSVSDIELHNYGSMAEFGEEDDENVHFKKLQAIREMPTSIAVKRRVRDKLLTEPVKVGQGCSHWRYRRSLAWSKTKIACREFSMSLELWRKSFRTIEGHFGSGVASYFVFLKWLFFLNIYIGFLMLLFILVPQAAFPVTTIANSSNTSDLVNYCSGQYNVTWNTTDVLQLILDFFSGTGYLEQTVLFIGHYYNTEVSIGVFNNVAYNYNMPLAYLCVVGAYILISLFLMARHTAKGFQTSLVASEDKHYQYCNQVFGGWDFALRDEINADLKHKSLYFEFTMDLQEERDEVRRSSRTRGQLCRVYLIRIIMILLVLAILGGCVYLIIFVSEETVKLTQKPDYLSYNIILKYLIEFLPSLTITGLNVVVPFLFKKFVLVEDYKPETEIQVTLFRTVFLRLASVAVLIATLYVQIECTGAVDICDVSVNSNTCPVLRCWETYVGQQLYKLVVMDFIITLAKPVLIEFPRMLIVKKCHCKLSQLIGLKEFVVTDNVLNLIYSQTICWLGAFFSPLIAPITMVKFFVMFYLQKVTLLYTHVPSKRPYRASKSNSFFMIVLLASFASVCVPIGWVIAKMTPSRGCGPFRAYSTCYQVITKTMEGWPSWFQTISDFIGSAGFVIPLIIVLILIIYYVASLLTAHKQMVRVLKDQLVLEGRDKHFLLTKLNELSGKSPVKKDRKQVEPRDDVDNESQTIRQRKTNGSFMEHELGGSRSPPHVPFDDNV